MNNIQIKNEVQDNAENTVKIIFSVTFDDGTAIGDGAIVITRAEWLSKNGNDKLTLIANRVSEKMLGTVQG